MNKPIRPAAVPIAAAARDPGERSRRSPPRRSGWPWRWPGRRRERRRQPPRRPPRTLRPPRLRVEADTSFSTFNPFLAYFDADLNVIASIYPTLTMINEQGQPAPYLATKWTDLAGQAHLDVHDPVRA